MKKHYQSPELFELVLNTTDVITASDNSYSYEPSGIGDELDIR